MSGTLAASGSQQPASTCSYRHHRGWQQQRGGQLGCRLTLVQRRHPVSDTNCRKSRALEADHPPRGLSQRHNSDEDSCSTSGQSKSWLERILNDPDIEGNPAQLLKVTEAYWKAMRQGKGSGRAPTVVRRVAGSLGGAPEFDVVMLGGTLGLLLALALQLRGWRVCVVERRRAEGRQQEWNSSRHDLGVLVQMGLLTQQEFEECIVSEFNPVRVGIKGMRDMWVDDCLNVGLCPARLIALLRQRFLAEGGVLKEATEFRAASVYDDGVELATGPGVESPLEVGDVNRPLAAARSDSDAEHAASSNGASSSGNSSSRPQRLHARLVLDCMGHYSSIVKQIRGARRPDGVLVVVGGCMDGVPPQRNRTADLLYSFTDSSHDLQLFWEAFPAAGGGRTTYMFAYTDAHPSRPSFTQLLQTYLELLPQYQGVELEAVKFRRLLMGGFPCYNDGPLRPQFDRVLQVGDAAASASPLSFGGFGAMLRHLPRLAGGVDDALREDALSRQQLALLQPYQPSLAVAWLYQRSMGLPPGLQRTDEGGVPRGLLAACHINRLLRANFSVMRLLGDRVSRPFLQDTLQAAPLAASMCCMMLRDPPAVAAVLPQVGWRVFLGWFGHFAALLVYTALHLLSIPLRPLLRRSYRLRRWMDAWKWGSGCDWQYVAPRQAAAVPGGGGQEAVVHGRGEVAKGVPQPMPA